jgi:penicillin G amidase
MLQAVRRYPLFIAPVALAAGLWVGTPGASQSTVQELARQALARIDGDVALNGLGAAVEVIRDQWGVPHIYASSPEDLFFAQGYVTAQDRLWQMEMWRRAAEGRLAEILGPQAYERDRVARLLRYRGPMDDSEWTVYHPQARVLMSAYARGVNAFIEQHGDRLPIEFVLTGIRPEPWSSETLVHRQTSFGNATSEIQLARQVAQLGVDEANRRANPDPPHPLRIPEGLDIAAFDRLGAELLAAMRTGGAATRPDVLPHYRGLLRPPEGPPDDGAVGEPGSNNWVVSGALSATGKPVIANDPHRQVANPSLRYLVHLHAPGWNVVGATEAPFIGVAIGHNDRLGWGLTIVGTDQHDVFVEELNPANPLEVRWNEAWEPLRVLREEIRVKGEAPRVVELKFSRHGPIFYEDTANHRAYALRSALHEPGTAPYLGSLRLAQARDCRGFLDAANVWLAPSENLICGDVEGNISWQAAALTPNREGWSGRLPVPGTGRYTWNGFRTDLPRELNPERGFIATANNNVNPPGYDPPLMFMSADAGFSRISRLRQMLRPDGHYTLADHQRMQTDALSLRAAADLPLFRGWTSDDPVVERARTMLAGWDGVYGRESAAAALYQTLRQGSAAALNVPVDQERLIAAIRQAVERLTASQGPEWMHWSWGRMHTRAFPHSFIADFNLPTVERPGGAGTVAADGASFREILNVADWDQSMVTSTPGQSAQPGSPFYDNLLPLWADDTYFPLVFTRQAVEERAAHRLVLRPSR